MSESTVCRIVHWVEEELMRSGCFRIPGKKQLMRGFGRPDVTVIDVTETPIERPQQGQKQFYSGKKKRHTLKCQVIVNQRTKEVICLFFGKGSQHDFKLFQASDTSILKLKVCKIKGIKGSKSYMLIVVYPLRNQKVAR